MLNVQQVSQNAKLKQQSKCRGDVPSSATHKGYKGYNSIKKKNIDEYVIMLNYVYLIIIINEKECLNIKEYIQNNIINRNTINIFKAKSSQHGRRDDAPTLGLHCLYMLFQIIFPLNLLNINKKLEKNAIFCLLLSKVKIQYKRETKELKKGGFCS